MRLVVFAILLAGAADARADGNLENWLIGPVIGFQLGGHSPSPVVIGFEGGGGYGPERFNLGFEHRAGKSFGYAEIDPWYLLGGSLGAGVDSDGEMHPVLGIWEGLPIGTHEPCSGWHPQISVAAGYRYTGVHEVYLTVKAGEMNGSLCWD